MKLKEDIVVMNVLCNLAKQLAHIEQKLDIKVDCTKIDTLETIVNGLLTKLNNISYGMLVDYIVKEE